MLVSQSLVFIHLTKCAGTFVRSALLEVDGPQQYAGRYHGPWTELPDNYHSMPVITAIRNPFDWWVSWYHFMKVHNWFNPIARAAVESGNESFSDMLQFIIASQNIDSDAAAFVDRAIHSHASSHNSTVNDFNSDMTKYMREHSCGILSWRYAFQLDGIPESQLTIIHQESLIDDLKHALNHVDKNLQLEQIELLANLPKQNTTKRSANYQEYYNNSSKHAVSNLEHIILKKFDYHF